MRTSQHTRGPSLDVQQGKGRSWEVLGIPHQVMCHSVRTSKSATWPLKTSM